jgi:S-adenosylmethionine:tRNA ribosyltransferase-isomerase
LAVRVGELQYELPPGLVARYPALRREDARLLCVAEDGLRHTQVSELDRLLPSGAVLVVNDSRVIPARLHGRKLPTGGRVELLLVERLGRTEAWHDGAARPAERWTAMARPAKRLRPGTMVAVGAELCAQIEAPVPGERLWQVALHARAGGPVEPLLAAEGHMPLPPYLGRDDEPIDRDRYQTVYARVPGAIAAPTAGLHLSDALLDAIRARGVQVKAITLHVGPGTFLPVSVPELDDHPMHAERYVVPAEAAAAIAEARGSGAPVIAVGTTVVRALESAADPDHQGKVRALESSTRLLIQPGFDFRVVDGLLTNFHLPGSTLLALVYAFGGTERVRDAYQAAIAERYRFYSYGDAMYLPPRVGATTRSA